MTRQRKLGEYFYQIRGRGWRIYQTDFVSDRVTSASEVRGEPLYHDREEARKRVYELNGWKYNGPKAAR